MFALRVRDDSLSLCVCFFPTNDRYFQPLGFSTSMSMNTTRISDYNWWWILQTNRVWDLIRKIFDPTRGRSSSGILMHSTINAFFLRQLYLWNSSQKIANKKRRTCSIHTHRKRRREMGKRANKQCVRRPPCRFPWKHFKMV